MKESWKHHACDLLAGIIVGGLVALAHHALVPPSLGLIPAVLFCMFVGMAAQMLACVVLGSFLGSMEMMIPGMFVGMLGMILPFFRMESLLAEVLVGGGIGFSVFLVFVIWDLRVRGTPQIVQLPGDCRLPEQTAAPRNSVVSAAWRNAAWLYDDLEAAGSKRHGRFQKELFQKMRGKILFGAAGTGLNFAHFPPGEEILAIDLSAEMLEAARLKALRYKGSISLQQADLERLPFGDNSFDTAATASTLCSVANPVQALKELYRVLKPGGSLLMFEHVRSRNPLLGAELDLLNLALRHLGPNLNRDTVANVQRAGFVVDHIVRAYLDIFLAIEAHKPGRAALAA